MTRWGDLTSFITGLWHAFVRAPELPYWIQRADFSSADFPPVRFRQGLAALITHDWAGELRSEDERTAADEESCPPGIGYLRGDCAVLHICPGAYGGAQCFFQRKGEILELPYVMEPQQRRLLRLFYGGRDKRLAGLFKSNMADPAWAEFCTAYGSPQRSSSRSRLCSCFLSQELFSQLTFRRESPR